MTISKRSIIMLLLLALSLGAYGAARCYSPVIVLYVVEQTLLQKSPAGIPGDRLRERFRALIAATADPAAKMARLLAISERLEKTQTLSVEELDELLAPDKK